MYMINRILNKIRNTINPPQPVSVLLRKKYRKVADIHPDAVLNNGFSIDLRKPVSDKKYVTIGKDCMVSANFIFESEEGEVTLGERVFLGGSNIICRTRIEFGSNIFVAWGCYFYDHNSHSLDHIERQNDITLQLEDYRTGRPNFIYSKNWDVVKSSPIKICDNAWIGMHAMILKGVTIGEGAIVAAGSVVIKDVEPWTMVGGNPAKFVKHLKPANP